jgi:hypothetical protein
MVRQHIMMEKYGRGKLLTSWQPGSRKRQSKGGQEQDTSPRAPLLMYLYFLITLSDYESINGLIQ